MGGGSSSCDEKTVCKDYIDKLDTCNKNLTACDGSLKDKDDAINVLYSTIEDKDTTINELNAKLQECGSGGTTTDTTDYKSKYETINNQYNQLNKKYETVNDSYKKLLNDYSDLETKWKNASTTKEGELSTLLAACQASLSSYEGADGQISECSAEKAKLESEKAKLSDELKAAKNEKDSIQSAYDTLTKEHTSTVNELNTYKSKITNADDTISTNTALWSTMIENFKFAWTTYSTWVTNAADIYINYSKNINNGGADAELKKNLTSLVEDIREMCCESNCNSEKPADAARFQATVNAASTETIDGETIKTVSRVLYDAAGQLVNDYNEANLTAFFTALSNVRKQLMTNMTNLKAEMNNFKLSNTEMFVKCVPQLKIIKVIIGMMILIIIICVYRLLIDYFYAKNNDYQGSSTSRCSATPANQFVVNL